MIRFRLALWYIAAVGALGALPYLAVVLADKGLSDPQIAAFMVVLPVGSLFAAPAWSWLADRTGWARGILTVTTLGTTLGFAVVAASQAPWLLFVGLALYAVARSPQSPIVDALAMRAMADGGRGYGRVRLWGSMAFLVTAYIAGWMREWWGLAPVALGAVLLTTTIAASRVLPQPRETAPRPKASELGAVFTKRSSAILAVACICHGVDLTFYNTFFGRHVESLAMPSNIIGTAVVVGVGAEVVVMAAAPVLLRRFRPSHLLLVSMLATVPRWLITAHTSDTAVLVVAQAAHGLSFGLFWVSAVPAFARHASASVARSAQSVLTAATFGIGPLIATPIAVALLANHPPARLFDVGAAAAALAALVLLPIALRQPTQAVG